MCRERKWTYGARTSCQPWYHQKLHKPPTTLGNLARMASEDDKEELLLSCRYGELDEVQRFVETYGADFLGDLRDENGNTALHLTCGNGHDGLSPCVLKLLVTLAYSRSRYP